MNQTPRKLGDYELLNRISDGAQATVYRGRHIASGEIVALKLFKDSGEDDTADQRFRCEADTLNRLSHRSIVRYRDSFSAAGDWDEKQNCLVTEFLEGETLKEYLSKHPKGMPWEEARDIIEQCLAGLIYARDKHGVTHRDLKPSNIFILAGGQVKLFDFGIARIEGGSTKTGGGACVGSFDYMAPDFALADAFVKPGEPAFRGDHISDIFSLTVCFYEMLTGRLPWRPFGERPELEYLAQWRTDKPKPPSHSPIVFRVVRHLTGFMDRGLSHDRSERFQNYEEMQEALRDLRCRTLSHKGKEEYELVASLDKGGFGEVYKARCVSNGRMVAIKRLFIDRATRRFVKEAEILRRYAHPHLVEYIDFFQNAAASGSKQLFLVMEYLEGMPHWSLRNRIRETPGGMDPGETLELFRYYLEALQYLHENVNQIIHRDIKPGNLYAPKDNLANAKILDLGVARDVSGTQTHGATPGTWDYMAPEFITESSRGSPPSDLYALGLSLYEAITGTPAFPRTSKTGQEAAAEFVARATGARKVVIDFKHEAFKKHPALERIIRQSTHSDPSKRFAGAARMRIAIMLLLKEMGRIGSFEIEEPDDTATSVSHPGTAETVAVTEATMFDEAALPAQEWQNWVSREKTRRNKQRAVIGALSLLVLIACAWLVTLVTGSREPEPARTTQPAAITIEDATTTPERHAAPTPPAPAATETVTPTPAALPQPVAVAPEPAPKPKEQPPEPVDRSRAQELIKELRLLRMRDLMGASFEAFQSDAMARADSARVLIAQPEYRSVRNSAQINIEQRQMWHHIAENAVKNFERTKDGRYLAAGRGALLATAELYGKRNLAVYVTVIQDWNRMSADLEFTSFLPIPQSVSLKPIADAAGKPVRNSFLDTLFQTELADSPAVMLPNPVTLDMSVDLGAGRVRAESMEFVLVPEGRIPAGEIPSPFYIAKAETTFGAMRCFREGARQDTRRNASLTRHFSGNLTTLGLQPNESPYELGTVSEAIEFCNWLSHRQGLKPVYTRNEPGNGWTADFQTDGFRLPTRIEWEYAARFGFDLHQSQSFKTWDSLAKELAADHPDSLVWFYYKDNPRAPVPGRILAYPLGMIDMCGNMGELAMHGPNITSFDDTGNAMSVCGGSFRSRTAEEVMPWASKEYGKEESTGFRVVLPVETVRFVR